jgi:hypothetical protein
VGSTHQVRIQVLGLGDALDVTKSFNNLTTVTLLGCVPNHLDPTPIVHNKLQRISIFSESFDDEGTVKQVGNSTTLPTLLAVKFSPPRNEDQPMPYKLGHEAFIVFLQCSGCSLRTFAPRCAAMTDLELIKCVRAMPTLETFEIHCPLDSLPICNDSVLSDKFLEVLLFASGLQDCQTYVQLCAM